MKKLIIFILGIVLIISGIGFFIYGFSLRTVNIDMTLGWPFWVSLVSFLGVWKCFDFVYNKEDKEETISNIP